MHLPENDFERLLFFEEARKSAEDAYAANPRDAENLTRWGGALLELAQFQNGTDNVKFVDDAVSKLEEALKLDPSMHNAVWCLGNAHTSHGFLVADPEAAKVYFDKAIGCFQQALNLEPTNDLYRKSLELAGKAPDLHLEIHRQMALNAKSGPSSSAKASKKKKKGNNDMVYDILGWVILAVGIASWIGMAKTNIPPPTPK